MAQIIPQRGGLFGRIGAGLGQGVGEGLAEQLPKEIENKRLKTGLKELSSKAGKLSPLEFQAEASGIYGITPQMIESFSQLARQQAQGNAYGNQGNDVGSQPISESSNIQSPSQQAQNQSQISRRSLGSQDVNQRTPTVRSTDITPEIVPENPLNPAERTRTPWTPKQRNAAISDYIKMGFFPDKAEQLAADDEQRDLATPGALQKQRTELTEKRKEARTEFTRQLEQKLQKNDKDVFTDITGEMLNNMERGLERDLVENPNLSFQEAANDWTNRALALAKTKSQLDKLGKTTGIETFFKGDTTLKKLNAYRPIFKKAGNLEEYQKLLQTNFDLSPQGAASIAYPPNEKLSAYISKYSPSNITDINRLKERSKKAAIDIGKNITTDDSLLSIARSLLLKDPYFDQDAFFEQLNEDSERLGLDDRQRLEIAEGSRDILPFWGDIKIFPFLRRPQ